MSNTIPEHTLATVETNADGQERYVCSCGQKGRWVADDEWARGAHKWHAGQARAIAAGERPADWGCA